MSDQPYKALVPEEIREAAFDAGLARIQKEKRLGHRLGIIEAISLTIEATYSVLTAPLVAELEDVKRIGLELDRDRISAEERAQAAEQKLEEARVIIDGLVESDITGDRSWLTEELRPGEIVHRLLGVKALLQSSETGEGPTGADAEIDRMEEASTGVRFTKTLQVFKDFTAEEIYDHLAEAIWEHERSPETLIWFSFWDRLNEGVNVPSMPPNPEPTDKEGGDDA